MKCCYWFIVVMFLLCEMYRFVIEMYGGMDWNCEWECFVVIRGVFICNYLGNWSEEIVVLLSCKMLFFSILVLDRDLGNFLFLWKGNVEDLWRYNNKLKLDLEVECVKVC